VKIRSSPQPIHLNTHLCHKDPQEGELSKVWIEERDENRQRGFAKDKDMKKRKNTTEGITEAFSDPKCSLI